VYDCWPVRGYERVCVWGAFRATARVAVRACVAGSDRIADRRCDQSYLLRHGRVDGPVADPSYGRGSNRGRGGWCERCTGWGRGRWCESWTGWGHERITGPAAGRVAAPVQKWQLL